MASGGKYQNVYGGGNVSRMDWWAFSPEGATRLYDQEARLYDPATGCFTRPDPLSHDYATVSHYSFCLNNPVLLTDPDGKKVLIHESSSREFQLDYKNAKEYLKGTTAGNIIENVEKDESYSVTLIDGKDFHRTCYDQEKNAIYWDSGYGAITLTVNFLSPAELLGHEFDHAQQSNTNPEQFNKDIQTEVEDYGNVEEKRVIEGAETHTAVELNRIGAGSQTRPDHSGTLMPVKKIDASYDEIEVP